MTRSNFRSAALAAMVLGAGFAAAPSAFAQDRFASPYDQGDAHAQPVEGDARAAIPPNVAGQYTCAFNEPHDRLERKNCGGVHLRY